MRKQAAARAASTSAGRFSSDLSEKTRKLFRELPLERRLRFRPV